MQITIFLFIFITMLANLQEVAFFSDASRIKFL